MRPSSQMPIVAVEHVVGAHAALRAAVRTGVLTDTSSEHRQMLSAWSRRPVSTGVCTAARATRRWLAAAGLVDIAAAPLGARGLHLLTDRRDGQAATIGRGTNTVDTT